MEKLVPTCSHFPIPAVIYLGDMLENFKSFKVNSRAELIDNDVDFYAELTSRAFLILCFCLTQL